MDQQVSVFGQMGDRPIREITLRNKAGAMARILEYGAVVRDLVVPKPGGGLQRVVLGLNSVADYMAHSPHFGAIAGRYANRIAHGKFTLDGVSYQLPLNQEASTRCMAGAMASASRPGR